MSEAWILPAVIAATLIAALAITAVAIWWATR